MSQITKEIFISTIESLREQSFRDISASNAISKVFDTDALYDNSLVIRATIKLLQVFFPKDENGFCEIEHYCFDMNYGKIEGMDLISAEDLWDRLDCIEVVDSLQVKINRIPWELDEAGQWERRKHPSILCPDPRTKEDFKGVLQYAMTSTHPLIDDNSQSDGV